MVCLVNFTDAPVPLPEGAVLLTSADVSNGTLPPDAAVWHAGATDTASEPRRR
jgi:alpha-glucosidase